MFIFYFKLYFLYNLYFNYKEQLGFRPLFFLKHCRAIQLSSIYIGLIVITLMYLKCAPSTKKMQVSDQDRWADTQY